MESSRRPVLGMGVLTAMRPRLVLVAAAGLTLAALPAFAQDGDAPATVAPHQRSVRLNRQDRNVVRTGPGDTFAIKGVFAKGTTFPIIAKSGDWYNIRLSDAETGWIHSSLCEEVDDFSDLEFRPNPRLYSRVGSFILTADVGGYSFDRKSNSVSVGGRLGYYVLDFLEVEGGMGWTHVVRPQETVESLFGLRLEEEKFDLLFYNLNLTLEVLPGRQMVPFITGGAGASMFQGTAETTWNLGAGTRLYLSKKTAIRWEVRNYRFTSHLDTTPHSNNNFEMILGTSFLM
jgi:outer membrane beta-barrel protein